jgi:Ca2+/Na+ antiporter
MFWILTLVLQVGFIVAGIRHEEKAGLWSWSKFLFALGFAGVEVVFAIVPVLTLDMHSRPFWWIVGAGWLVAVLNFIWFIIACRRWKLPDGRSSLEADRDGQSH